MLESNKDENTSTESSSSSSCLTDLILQTLFLPRASQSCILLHSTNSTHTHTHTDTMLLCVKQRTGVCAPAVSSHSQTCTPVIIFLTWSFLSSRDESVMCSGASARRVFAREAAACCFKSPTPLAPEESHISHLCLLYFSSVCSLPSFIFPFQPFFFRAPTHSTPELAAKTELYSHT